MSPAFCELHFVVVVDHNARLASANGVTSDTLPRAYSDENGCKDSLDRLDSQRTLAEFERHPQCCLQWPSTLGDALTPVFIDRRGGTHPRPGRVFATRRPHRLHRQVCANPSPELRRGSIGAAETWIRWSRANNRCLPTAGFEPCVMLITAQRHPGNWRYGHRRHGDVHAHAKCTQAVTLSHQLSR